MVGESHILLSDGMVHACFQQSMLHLSFLQLCLHHSTQAWHVLLLLLRLTFLWRVRFGQLPLLQLSERHMHSLLSTEQGLVHHDAGSGCCRHVGEDLLPMLAYIHIPTKQ